MSHTIPANAPLLDEYEAANILNVKVSTLRAWRSTGKSTLKFCRIGRAIRYSPQDIAAFIEAGKATSTTQGGSHAA